MLNAYFCMCSKFAPVRLQIEWRGVLVYIAGLDMFAAFVPLWSASLTSRRHFLTLQKVWDLFVIDDLNLFAPGFRLSGPANPLSFWAKLRHGFPLLPTAIILHHFAETMQREWLLVHAWMHSDQRSHRTSDFGRSQPAQALSYNQ